MPPHKAGILGALFLRNGRRLTQALTILSGTVTALALCALVGLSTFLGHVATRAESRGLGPDTATGCIQGSYRFDPIGLEQYDSLLLSATCESPPAPPGLLSFPRPGEVYLSPELARLRTTNAHIAARYPHVTGPINAAGLTGSNELRAIIGVPVRPTDTIGTVRFNDFGGPTDYLATYLRIPKDILVLLALLFTLPATGVLIASCTRLNARVRERQLRLLGVVGVPGPALQLALVIESTVLVSLGAIIGTLLAAPVLARGTLHFAAWTAFTRDLKPPAGTYLLAPLLVAASAAVASWRGSRFWRTSTTGQAATQGWWRWAILLAGLVIAAVATWHSIPSSVELFGKLVTAVGLAVVAAPLCACAGERLSGARSTRFLIAGARLRNPAGALTRSLSAFAAGLFILSIGTTTLENNSENAAAQAQALSPDGITVLEIRRPSQTVIDSLQGKPILSGTTAPPTGGVAVAISGPCTALRRLIGNPQLTCPDQPVVNLAPGDPPLPGTTAKPTVLPGPRSSLFTGFLITPSQSSTISPHDDLVLVPLPQGEAQFTYDSLTASDPTTNVRFTGWASVTGTSELQSLLDVFRWGGTLAVLLSGLSVLISLVSLTLDRQPGNNYLQILGVTPRHTGITTLTEVTTAAATCTLLSLFATWLWALVNPNPEHPITVATVAIPFLIAFPVLTIAAAATIWSALHTNQVDIVPDSDNLASAHDTFATSLNTSTTLKLETTKSPK